MRARGKYKAAGGAALDDADQDYIKEGPPAPSPVQGNIIEKEGLNK